MLSREERDPSVLIKTLVVTGAAVGGEKHRLERQDTPRRAGRTVESEDNQHPACNLITWVSTTRNMEMMLCFLS